MCLTRLTDEDLIEAFYGSTLLEQLTDGRDRPAVVLAALRRATPADRAEIARECAAKAVDIDIGRYGDDDEPGFIAAWAAQLRRVAEALQS